MFEVRQLHGRMKKMGLYKKKEYVDGKEQWAVGEITTVLHYPKFRGRFRHVRLLTLLLA